MTCSHCHSENVVRDAWAQWDNEKQKWRLFDIFPESFCRDCEGETNIAPVLIKEPETGN
jgi:hypothetical protein